MPPSSPRKLFPVVLAYLPVPIVGAILSVLWNVGATPEGSASDMFLRGTALTPPLFLPAILVAAAVASGRGGRTGRIASAVVSLIALAFLAGSTANLPADFAAADSAGTPLALTAGLAAIHLALSITLLYNAVPTAFGRMTAQRPAAA